MLGSQVSGVIGFLCVFPRQEILDPGDLVVRDACKCRPARLEDRYRSIMRFRSRCRRSRQLCRRSAIRRPGSSCARWRRTASLFLLCCSPVQGRRGQDMAGAAPCASGHTGLQPPAAINRRCRAIVRATRFPAHGRRALPSHAGSRPASLAVSPALPSRPRRAARCAG